MLPGNVISTILKHDAKVTSYKIALLRAINDLALNFPDLGNVEQDVAVPLRILAQFWVAYYWSFVKLDKSILQGQRSRQGNILKNDMEFRPQLTELRQEWEQVIGGISRPSDGFFLINELRVPRKYQTYPKSLHQAYSKALSAISRTLEMPVKYAGYGHWTVFAKPVKYVDIGSRAIPIPSTQPTDKCLIIPADLWQTFQEMSLWVEALCIHEWCLFTEKVQQEAERGTIYQLLTDRPDNRRPLTWERNQIDLLLMEDRVFICPWTKRRITRGIQYDLDHILPVSLYPINELWNLVPAEPEFNSNNKRDRLPTQETLQQALPCLEKAYKNYGHSKLLSIALREDVAVRFSTVSPGTASFPLALANSVVNLIDIVAESRNLARF